MSSARRPRITRALQSRNFRLFFGGQTVSLVGTWITRIATSWLVYRLTGSALLLGLSGRITVAQVLVLQIGQGIIDAFDTPARQSFVVEMVEDRADLPNAIALNSSMVNASRIIGPSIGGIVIAAVGEGWCFFADAVSYLAVIASLLAMTVAPREKPHRATPMLDELRTGFRYVSRFVPVRSALLLLALVSVMGMPYTVLMPAISANVLHGGPHTLGFLMTASGAGALAGALYLAQTVVAEELRGRVMAFYTMAFLSTAPIGSLLAGIAADRVGTQRTILFGGVSCLAAAVWFALKLPRLRMLVRPIYVERGILAAAEIEAGTKSL